MSIYTHDLFQRDNPSLCDQMDGGHRRRTSRKNSELQNSDFTLGDVLGAGRTPIINSAHTMNQLQEHNSNLLIQQMQQMQQQNFLIQQMQQQMVQSNQQQQQGNSQRRRREDTTADEEVVSSSSVLSTNPTQEEEDPTSSDDEEELLGQMIYNSSRTAQLLREQRKEEKKEEAALSIASLRTHAIANPPMTHKPSNYNMICKRKSSSDSSNKEMESAPKKKRMLKSFPQRMDELRVYAVTLPHENVRAYSYFYVCSLFACLSYSTY